MGKVASFYSAPVVKFLLRFLIHLINLVLYTLTLTLTPNPNPNPNPRTRTLEPLP